MLIQGVDFIFLSHFRKCAWRDLSKGMCGLRLEYTSLFSYVAYIIHKIFRGGAAMLYSIVACNFNAHSSGLAPVINSVQSTPFPHFFLLWPPGAFMWKIRKCTKYFSWLKALTLSEMNVTRLERILVGNQMYLIHSFLGMKWSPKCLIQSLFCNTSVHKPPVFMAGGSY